MTQTNQSWIQDQRDALRLVLDAWETGGNIPPNYVRRDGIGKQVALVDVWCGGYQRPQDPIVIGWKACGPSGRTNQGESGCLIVADHGGKEATINVAMAQTDAALARLGWKTTAIPERVE